MTRELIQAEVGNVLDAGAAPFVVGGDHSVALPVLRALHSKYGRLAVLHVDAHLDTSDAGVWGDPYHHGTPFRHALTEGLIERGQLHQVGIRASWGSSDDGELGKAHGARVTSIDDLATRGVEAVVKNVVAQVGSLPLYVSFDIDAVDPAYAPGTGTPVAGGLTSREAIGLLRGLVSTKLVGMDLVEVCPLLDHAEITSHLAAALLFEGLAVFARNRRG